MDGDRRGTVITPPNQAGRPGHPMIEQAARGGDGGGAAGGLVLSCLSGWGQCVAFIFIVSAPGAAAAAACCD